MKKSSKPKEPAKPKEPTGAEIEAEIKLLKELRPKVNQFNGFEDDNHAAIDAQIKVLEERMDEDDAEEEYGDGNAADNVRSAAMDACMWMIGEYEGDEEEGPNPSDAWKPLSKG